MSRLYTVDLIPRSFSYMKSLASVIDRNARKRTASSGLYYRIEVCPEERFVDYLTHDVGTTTKRLTGQNVRGIWRTKSWLIQKEDAHVEGKILIIDAPETKRLLHTVEGTITHYKGDVYIVRSPQEADAKVRRR